MANQMDKETLDLEDDGRTISGTNGLIKVYL
jgi:hypothetical protein